MGVCARARWHFASPNIISAQQQRLSLVLIRSMLVQQQQRRRRKKLSKCVQPLCLVCRCLIAHLSSSRISIICTLSQFNIVVFHSPFVVAAVCVCVFFFLVSSTYRSFFLLIFRSFRFCCAFFHCIYTRDKRNEHKL